MWKSLLSRALEKAMATHSTTLAWQIPWTEEPGRLQSMGSLGVGHEFTFTFTFTFTIYVKMLSRLFDTWFWRKNWAGDRHLDLVSLCMVVKAVNVGKIIKEEVLNNFIIHPTRMCWVPPCTWHHTGYGMEVKSNPQIQIQSLLSVGFQAKDPQKWMTLTPTDEWTFTNGDKCSDTKTEILWEHRVQKSLV